LFQIPATDAHLIIATLVLIQALRKSFGIGLAAPRLTSALVRSLASLKRRILLGLGRLSGATTKETAYSVADGRTDRDSPIATVVSDGWAEWVTSSGTTDMAVEAICPNRPSAWPAEGFCCVVAGGAAVLALRCCCCCPGLLAGRAGAAVGRAGAREGAGPRLRL
jgi:hypothetical protein